MASGYSHPLDQHFKLLLNTLQLDDFCDYYRTKGVLSDSDIEVLYSNSMPQSTRRYKINYLVKAAKQKDPDLKKFLWALKISDQSKHKDLLNSLESSMKEFLESRRESEDSYDEAYDTMTHSFGSLGLDEYSHDEDDEEDEFCIEDDFNQICCSSCTSPINVIGDTADIINPDNCTNPHGYMHEFYNLAGISPKCRIKYDGKWHSEDSWYEGYSWMIICCRDCKLHWGWCFDTLRNQGDRFYGIRLDSICLRKK